jgi:hypothetical protein
MALIPRAGGASVRVSDARGDSAKIGAARVQLKLAALGYAGVRHGLDADPAIVQHAVNMLCEAAARYYGQLSGRPVTGRGLRLDHDACTRLRLAAVAYAGVRHGADANEESARAGLGIVCQASIRYCEALVGGKPPPVTDPHLQLDGGS